MPHIVAEKQLAEIYGMKKLCHCHPMYIHKMDIYQVASFIHH